MDFFLFIWSNKQPGHNFVVPLIGTLLNVFILRPPATFYCNFCQRPTIANLYFKEESNTGNFNSFEKWMANPGISFYCFMSGFISLLILSFFTVSNKSSFKFCTKKTILEILIPPIKWMGTPGIPFYCFMGC